MNLLPPCTPLPWTHHGEAFEGWPQIDAVITSRGKKRILNLTGLPLSAPNREGMGSFGRSLCLSHQEDALCPRSLQCWVLGVVSGETACICGTNMFMYFLGSKNMSLPHMYSPYH